MNAIVFIGTYNVRIAVVTTKENGRQQADTVRYHWFKEH